MLLALLLAQASPDVVVTGERLQRIHDECRARKCSPLRDAQASVAWAETLFRDGRYVDAKRVMRDAAARNRGNAKSHPKPVAAIYEAYATVALQEGDQDVVRKATGARVRTLRDNLPPDDVAVRGAALAMGDMWLKLGAPYAAGPAYLAAERAALARGQGDVALRARLARARLEHLFGDRKAAATLVNSATTIPGADKPLPAAAIRATRLRFAAADAKPEEVAALARALNAEGLTRPVLLYTPPFPRTASDLADSTQRRGVYTLNDLPALAAVTPRGADMGGIRWADIGYWIRPDGRTAEVEVLKGSTAIGWTGPYIRQIEGRRYSATAVAMPDEPGVYRVERFTIRPNYMTPSDSLIRRRVGIERLEVLDLTDPNAKVTAPS